MRYSTNVLAYWPFTKDSEQIRVNPKINSLEIWQTRGRFWRKCHNFKLIRTFIISSNKSRHKILINK